MMELNLTRRDFIQVCFYICHGNLHVLPLIYLCGCILHRGLSFFLGWRYLSKNDEIIVRWRKTKRSEGKMFWKCFISRTKSPSFIHITNLPSHAQHTNPPLPLKASI